MQHFRATLLAAAGMLAISSTAAHASVDEYSVGASTTVRINLVVCSAESQLAVQGDAGTDLDFVVTSPDGEAVHSDEGIDDYLSVILEKPGEGCSTFGLAVANLGEEANTFQVVLEPINEASTRVEKYIIAPNDTKTVNFKACGTSAQLTARGDGDTDLDFVIRNSDGGVVHEDAALEDETSATLAGLLSDCETFEMDVSNLGEVYNALIVMVSPEGASAEAFSGIMPSTSLASGLTGVMRVADSEGAGEYRADANSSITVNLPVCGVNRLEVRGDGDTDLDFTVKDSTGTAVHSDFDLTDVTFASLTPTVSECEDFSLEVSNLGDVYNVFSVELTPDADLGGETGAGEYRINANGSSKVLMRLCDSTVIYARGDGDTDLDFDITDGAGNTVHSDYDLTDQTQTTIDPEGVCADYQMSISNLGDVYNVLTVTFDEEPNIPATIQPAGEAASVIGTGPGEYSAPANSTVAVNLPICDRTFVSVAGDGDTDLDYQMMSSDGTVVHSDYDLTDQTAAALTPDAPGDDGCEVFSMTVENLGDVYNVFTVSYDGIGGAEAAVEGPVSVSTGTSIEVGEDTISTDGNNRNIAILNRTGEALTDIYWSNSATLDWGEDHLAEGGVLAAGQQWNVYGGDSSNACLFDFKAVTQSGRELSSTSINICEVSSVAFE